MIVKQPALALFQGHRGQTKRKGAWKVSDTTTETPFWGVGVNGDAGDKL